MSNMFFFQLRTSCVVCISQYERSLIYQRKVFNLITKQRNDTNYTIFDFTTTLRKLYYTFYFFSTKCRGGGGAVNGNFLLKHIFFYLCPP